MATTPITVGAALTLSETIVQGQTTELFSQQIITTTPLQICANSADRVELVIWNTGTDDAMIYFDSSISNTIGFRIPANGGFIIFKVREDFQLVSRLFYARAVVTSSLLTVVEVVRINQRAPGT